MGLSASQARLLSITARISDNELHSQQIANSKVRLADKTQEASREYVQALDSQKLVYTTYDAKGNPTQQDLNASMLYNYSSIKNQYGISNSAGQLLISTDMAKTYQTSKTLLDFLKANGCEVKNNEDYDYWMNTLRGNNNKTKDTIIGYYNQIGTVSLSTVDTVLAKSPSQLTSADAASVNNFMNTLRGRISTGMRDCDGSFGIYVDSLETFNLKFPDLDNDPKYHIYSTTGQTYDKMFEEASASCYNTALRGSYGSGCYQHVLATLTVALDDVKKDSSGLYVVDTGYKKSYTTTTGKSQDILAGKINGSAIKSNGKVRDMAEVGQYLIRNNIKVPDTTINYNGNPPTGEGAKLLSYKKDDGTLKTYQEMIIDVFYAVSNYSTLGLNYDKHLKPFLEEFQQGLKKTLTMRDLYDRDVANWQATLQTWKDEFVLARDKYLTDIANMPEKEIPANDDCQTQWFINLWRRLNGSSDNNVNYDRNATKESGQKWKVLENNLFKSTSWIQYALQQGIISLEQVQYVEDADNSNVKTSKWLSKEYASCVDITFIDDETAIAKAEANYTRKLKDIEAQDKQFDNEIKKLDTEHNALQTEYESVKSVVDKNVERSFKAFS